MQFAQGGPDASRHVQTIRRDPPRAKYQAGCPLGEDAAGVFGGENAHPVGNGISGTGSRRCSSRTAGGADGIGTNATS